MDFCSKSSGNNWTVYFKNRVDRGSAVIFYADSGLCLSYVRILGPKGSLDHRSFFILSRYMYVDEFIQITSFLERTSLKLRCKTVIVAVLCFSHQACCLLYIWGKLTVAFTFTSLPFILFLPLHFDVVEVSDLNKNFGKSTDFAKKGTERWICIPLSTPLIKFASTHLYTWVDSGTMRVSLAQDDNTMSSVRTRTT